MTGLNSNIAKEKQKSFDETKRHIPTNGISTISSAIREQSINPRKDNYGLYALKQDRSLSMENAKRGILLSIPSTTKIHTRAEIHSFRSMERNHEVFQSCEKVVNSSGITHEGNYSTSPSNEAGMRIEPPPRRKKRQTATRQFLHHSKQHKAPIMRQAHTTHCVIKEENLGMNDSELYRIVNTEKAKVMVEEPRKKEHVVTMVKPKIQKAERIKFQHEKPPVVAKVKSYEWQKHQRKASVGNLSLKPPLPISTKKKYSVPCDSSSSIRSDNSVDIFQSNRLKDQQKLFDEFDELFKRNKDGNNDKEEPTAESTLRKLRELKKSSSASSFSSPLMRRKTSPDDDMKPSSVNVKTLESLSPEVEKELSVLERTVERVEEISTKPKIISEQPKAVTNMTRKKIIYYDDEKELKQLIMNQTQSTTIINNHFATQIIPNLVQSNKQEISTILNDYGVGGKMPNSIMRSTGQRLLDSSQFDDTSTDYHRHLIKQQKVSINANTTDTNGNSLRIFSNEGIFVFNL